MDGARHCLENVISMWYVIFECRTDVTRALVITVSCASAVTMQRRQLSCWMLPQSCCPRHQSFATPTNFNLFDHHSVPLFPIGLRVTPSRKRVFSSDVLIVDATSDNVSHPASSNKNETNLVYSHTADSSTEFRLAPFCCASYYFVQ